MHTKLLAHVAVARRYPSLIARYQKLRCLWNRLLCSQEEDADSSLALEEILSGSHQVEDLGVNGRIILEIGAVCGMYRT